MTQIYDDIQRFETLAEQCADSESGLEDFLTELGNALGPAARQVIHRLAEERRALRVKRPGLNEAIVGAEEGLREVMAAVRQVARSDAPVLILGETGTGKEVVARAVHSHSKRANGPFLRVNCGAIPPELIDSELFGHERGSFTGASGTRKGWFERADGTRHATAMSLGHRPTFYDRPQGAPLLEYNLLDFASDLYGEAARVEFTNFLRSERKFDGIDALISQLKQDIDHARSVLGI